MVWLPLRGFPFQGQWNSAPHLSDRRRSSSGPTPASTPDSRSENLEIRGFDSSRLLFWRGRIRPVQGEALEFLEPGILTAWALNTWDALALVPLALLPLVLVPSRTLVY